MIRTVGCSLLFWFDVFLLSSSIGMIRSSAAAWFSTPSFTLVRTHHLRHRLSALFQHSAAAHEGDRPQPQMNMEEEVTEDEKLIQLTRLYLERIGFESTSTYKSNYNRSDMDMAPLFGQQDLPNLQRLLDGHLRRVPFENMDQHHHPAGAAVTTDKNDDENSNTHNAPAIPRLPVHQLPSLNVMNSVTKIVHHHRGGFCYEVNFAFSWLLRQLGYSVRLAVADVGCSQVTPGHVVLLVDNLLSSNSTSTRSSASVLVDVGFGCPGVCDVVLPLVYNQTVADPHGDLFRFDQLVDSVEDPFQGRFDTVLLRTRKDTGEEEPMYRFHSMDDMEYEAAEFAAGLHHVLTVSPTFNQKRLCVISTETGHITLGKDYIKWVEQWKTVRHIDLPTETAWREALQSHFGVNLCIR